MPRQTIVHIKRLLWILAGCFPAAICAQNAPNDPVERAYALKTQDNFVGAIAILRPLADSGSNVMPASKRGLICNLLGSVYQDVGDYNNARRWYQEAIYLLENDTNGRKELASATDNLGSLESSLGHLDTSERLRKKAAILYQSIGDHQGMARVYINLAVTAIAKNDLRSARDEFLRATNELSVPSSLGDGDQGSLLCVQGWLELKSGNPDAAVRFYDDAIVHWARLSGTESLAVATASLFRANALLKENQTLQATTDVQHAETIISEKLGTRAAFFWKAKLLESAILRQQGKGAEAREMKKSAEKNLDQIMRDQCGNCTTPAEAFR
jgi:tetratricopeptide (TPR) repeat protein